MVYIMQNVFIVGAKNCGAYGGYETFLDKLTEYHENNNRIKYHIAWKGTENKEFEYHNAHCFQIKVPDIGPAQAIYYDVAALKYCIKYIKNIIFLIRLCMFLHAVSDLLPENFTNRSRSLVEKCM